jgi:23S rRNA (adenine1618-N6)-methyltransferase
MHPRNRHTGRYDFEKLVESLPTLKPFVTPNKYGDLSIDFANPKAVQTLNHALLKQFYGISFWQIPENYLCPPIPGRSDYIHQIADLLASQNDRAVPSGKEVRILDVGVGASCIYPIIGHSEYGWSFVGSEVDPIALESAQKIIQSNAKLAASIEIRKQPTSDCTLKNIVKKDEYFDVMICNPPFHSSLEEAEEGSRRKWRNLGKTKQLNQSARNFGGQGGELWCPGGEVSFIKKLIQESSLYQNQFTWFSSLVSKDSSLDAIYKALQSARVYDTRTLDMTQGQKKSRIVAWRWRHP